MMYDSSGNSIPISVVNQRKMSDSLVHDIDEKKVFIYNFGLFISTTILVILGLAMVFSASYNTMGTSFFDKQLIWIFLSTIMAITAYLIGYKTLAKYSTLLVVGILILLTIALFNKEVNGANRWIFINLPGFSFSLQPSELGKIALVVFLSDYCAKNYRTFPSMTHIYGMWYPSIVTIILAVMIFAGDDLGTTVLILATAWFIFFAARMQLKFLFLVPSGLFVLLLTVILLFDRMRLARITSVLFTQNVKDGDGYQLWNSLLALGSGGWFGRGFLESRLKAFYLPEAHTDFILSIWGEEMGFVGILIVFVAYIAFSFFAFAISLNARSKLGMFMGFGLSIFITLQTIINITVVAGLAPTKGMPAPFLSYGGSSLMSCFIAVGILLSIGNHTINENYNDGFYKILNFFKKLVIRNGK